MGQNIRPNEGEHRPASRAIAVLCSATVASDESHYQKVGCIKEMRIIDAERRDAFNVNFFIAVATTF